MDVLTFTSLVLEIVGFSLALIETVWPKRADRIEYLIDRWIEDLAKLNVHERLKNSFQTIGSWYGWISLIMIVTVGFSLLEEVMRDIYNSWPPHSTLSNVGMFIVFIILLGLTIFTIPAIPVIISRYCLAPSLKLISFSFSILNRLAHGHALGAFGLILAFLGVIFQIIDSF